MIVTDSSIPGAYKALYAGLALAAIAVGVLCFKWCQERRQGRINVGRSSEPARLRKDLQDGFRGAMVGAVIGDCLGAPLEFSRNKKYANIRRICVDD